MQFSGNQRRCRQFSTVGYTWMVNDCGYGETTVNNCIYLLVILNIFKPKNFRFPTYKRFLNPQKGCDIGRKCISNWLILGFLASYTNSQTLKILILKEVEKNERRAASEVSPYFSHNIRNNFCTWRLPDDELDMAFSLGLGTSAI
jgi:hypothetical protein